MKKYLLLLLATASLTSHAQGSLNSGLLGRFPFDNNLVDATGNITNFSDANVAYGTDSHGQASAALRLTGTGEVSVEPSGLLDFGTTGSFTFSVAFRTLSSGTQAIFSNQGSYTATSTADSRGWSLGFDNGQVGKVYLNLVRSVSTNGGLGLATQASFNDGLWHTAVMVVNRTSRQIRLFVDGTAQALTYVSSNPTYGTVAGSTFTLGSTATMFVDLTPGYSPSLTNVSRLNNRFGLSYNGWLDEARFYNRVLTDAEVQTLSAQVLATLTAQEAAAQVQVAPNPLGGAAAFTVALTQPVAASQLRVVDLLGRPVPVAIVARQAGSRLYELSGLATGLYLLHVTLPQGEAVRRIQVN
ncbi:MAG: LamG-like jellyroll fold domain-containing protein [Janthinobacterium lividum]